MEVYLEKRIYVFRKSFNYFNDIGIGLMISKFILSSTGLSAFAFLPLAALSLSASIVDVVDKTMKLNERKEEYRHALKFYQSLLNNWKINQDEQEIYKREEEFVKTLQFVPREKYVKKAKLNGYQWIT